MGKSKTCDNSDTAVQLQALQNTVVERASDDIIGIGHVLEPVTHTGTSVNTAKLCSQDPRRMGTIALWTASHERRGRSNLRVTMLTPSLKGSATTSTRESFLTTSLNSLMASAASSLTCPGQYVLPCNAAALH
jgi:hypothetical protein